MQIKSTILSSRALSWLSDARSNSLWIRALVLWVGLAVIKFGLLVQMGDYLFQEHWRVGGWRTPEWLGPTAYTLFLILVAVTFVVVWRALTRSKHPPVSVLRGFVAFFCFFGTLFVISAYYVIENSYWQSMFDGFLTGWNVWEYLKLYLFFAQPYFAIYIAGFVLSYWILFRSGREIWVVPLLALMTIAYLVFGMRLPYDYPHEVALCVYVGLAGLIAYAFAREPLNWKWQVASLAPGILGLLLFAVRSANGWDLNPCFALILVISSLLLWWGNVLGEGRPFHSALTFFLPFCFLSFFLLASHHYRLAANYNHAFIYGMALPRYLAQETATVLLLVGGAHLIWRKTPTGARLIFDLLGGALLLLGLIDLELNRSMGFRLDWNALVVSNDPVLLWRTVRPRLVPLGLATFCGAVLYCLLLRLGKKLVQAQTVQPRALRLSGPAIYGLALFGTMMCGGRTLLWEDKAERSPLWNIVATSPLALWLQSDPPSRDEFASVARQIGMGEAARRSAESLKDKPRARDLNVVLVILESAYNRYLSMFGAADETQPLLKKYRSRMELFPNFYSNFPSSLNARFSILSGLYACKPYVTYVNPRIEAPCLLDLFRRRNYVVSLFDSSFKEYQRWNDYLRFHPVDLLYDAENMPGATNYPKVSWGVNETATLEAMKNQLATHASRNERFFLTYIPVMPHMPFDTPSKQFEKFDNGVGNITSDYTGRYKNQLLFMDWVLASLIEELERLELLGKTLVVITDDHGEMVGEDSHHLGHGWSVAPVLCNVPLIIMDPQHPGERVNFVPGSQVDVLPTVLDLMKMPVPEGELYEGVSLYSPEAQRERPIYILSQQQRAVLKGSRYYVQEPQNGGHSVVCVYETSHEGVKSYYRLLDDKVDISAELDRFSRVQRDLILRYSYWQTEFQKLNPSR